MTGCVILDTVLGLQLHFAVHGRQTQGSGTSIQEPMLKALGLRIEHLCVGNLAFDLLTLLLFLSSLFSLAVNPQTPTLNSASGIWNLGQSGRFGSGLESGVWSLGSNDTVHNI